MAKRGERKRNVKLKRKRRTVVFNVNVAKRRKSRSKSGKGGMNASSTGLRRAVLVPVVLFSMMIMALMFWSWFVVGAGFAVKWVRVDRAHMLSEREILALADVKIGSNLLLSDLEKIRARICAHPDIKDAVVSRKIPGGIQIKVYERFPVAAIHYRKRYVIDEEGVVLSARKERMNRCVPFLTGLRLKDVRVGEALHTPGLKKALEVVKRYHETELCRQIELISVDMSDPTNVVMRSHKIEEIRLGEKNLDERLKLLSYILKQRSDQGRDGPARYIDLRWNDVTEMPLEGNGERRS
jgi:cell division septal protein FtsQ